jgi:hypothetical protein
MFLFYVFYAHTVCRVYLCSGIPFYYLITGVKADSIAFKKINCNAVPSHYYQLLPSDLRPL